MNGKLKEFRQTLAVWLRKARSPVNRSYTLAVEGITSRTNRRVKPILSGVTIAEKSILLTTRYWGSLARYVPALILPSTLFAAFLTKREFDYYTDSYVVSLPLVLSLLRA